MKIRFYNIQWDTDGEPYEDCGLKIELIEDVPADLDVCMEGADYLSDKYGFCVFGFDFLPQA